MLEGQAIDMAVIEKQRWAQQEAQRHDSGRLGNTPTPRAPGLTQMAESLNERANSLHELASALEAQAARLFAHRSNAAGIASDSAKQPAPPTIEERLASASMSFSHLEGRLRTLIQRFSDGI